MFEELGISGGISGPHLLKTLY